MAACHVRLAEPAGCPSEQQLDGEGGLFEEGMALLSWKGSSGRRFELNHNMPWG